MIAMVLANKGALKPITNGFDIDLIDSERVSETPPEFLCKRMTALATS